MKSSFNNMKSVLFVAVLATWLQSSSGESQISIRTAEMTSVGTFLVSIPQELKIPSVDQKQFKILSGNKYAKVDERTGILTVANELDRETLCPDNPEHCNVDVAVVVFPSGENASPTSLTIVKIQIEITDINDNRPKFENSNIEKMISEGVEPGTHIRLDSAMDPDLGVNSIQDYSIRSADETKSFKKFFKLQVIENIDGTKIPQLELKTSLDREKKAVHVLILEAVDGGTPALTGTTTVRINVTDSNDNNPTFKKDVYVVNVNEHEEVGTVVIKLVAEDKDTGMNGVIRYKFPSVVSAKDQEIFNLDQETGVISVRNKEKLDYETTKIHHLTVEANDMGQNSASAYATVTVKVQDINDNKPEVDVSFMEIEDVTIMEPNMEYDAIVKEDIAVGSFLAFVTITDKDGGENGTVSCQIRNNDIFNLLSIEETTSRYLLKTVTNLDREEMNFYDIEIEARDHGSIPQITVKTIKIKVGDVNDNAPDFVHPQFLMSVSETAKANAVVMRLKAKDIDENPGPNSKITYKLVPPSDGIEKDGKTILLSDIFEIDEDSGNVRLVQEGVLDAEVIREAGYMTVSAKDNGTPSLSTTTKLRVSIVDENDNSPIFQQEEYVFRIDEHSTNGKFVGQVKAIDADFDNASNGYVRYSIQSYDDDVRRNDGVAADDWMVMFQADDEEGFINFSGDVAKLDREARLGRPITFYAVATDNGTPRNSARVKVSIYLNDVNDNAPVVTYPNVTTDIAFVRIPQVISGTETQAEIAEDNENIASASRSSPNAGQEWSSIVTVLGSTYANEELEKPTLTHVEATDPDEGENAQLSFAIVDGNNRNYFDIDVQSGNITLAPGLDLNSIYVGCHVLKILVKDLGDQPMSSFAYANIFLSRFSPKSTNFSRTMLDCQNDPLYPHPQKDLINSAGLDELTLYIIIGFSVLILIILIIIVVILIRYKCCPAAQKSRTYNCQKGENIYSSPIYGGSPGKRNKRRPRSVGNEKGGHRHSGHAGQGTVDSRSSFYSEWTASQNQIAQEKMDLVGALPALQSEGSVGSHNSAGRDSGTGDSMPSDAYHTVAPSLGEVGYPYNQVSYLPPLPTHTPSVSGYPVHHQQNMNEGNMGMTKCTEECHLYGHSDACWMPDSLLRPPSRLTSFKQDYDSPVRNLSHSSFQRQQPNEMIDPRFQKGDPNTPFYYDPGRKFIHLGSSNGNEYPPYQTGTAGRNYSGYPDDGRSDVASDDGNISQQPRSHPGSHAGSHAPSNVSVPVGVPHQMGVHPTTVSYTPMNPQAGRNRAYVHLQGYEDPNQPDENHSNLSSASSNNVPYSNGYIANPPPYDNPNRPPVHYASSHPSSYSSYYDPVSYNPNYPAFLPSYDNSRSEHDHVPYEEDYSASNLLLSPINTETEYRQQWDRMQIDPASSGPYFSSAKQNNRGTPANVSYNIEDKQSLQENQQTVGGNREDVSNASSAKEQATNLGEKGDAKLSTIDEIDAEAVVAEIDGLLL